VSTAVRLYHFPLSLESQIVRVVLCEKGLRWEERLIDPGPPYRSYEPWYLGLNPRGRVPTLEHQGRILTDAVEIARYLDGRFPGPALVPGDPAQRRTVEEWLALQGGLPSLDLTYACLGVLLRRAALHDFARRRRRLSQLRRRHPGLSASFDRILEDLGDWEASIRDAALLTALMEELGQALDRLEARLGGRHWILGDRYSLADVVWGVALARFDLIRLAPLWERGRRPDIDAYYARFKARPCFRRAGVVNRHDPGLVVPAVLRAARAPMAGLAFAGALGVLLAAMA